MIQELPIVKADVVHYDVLIATPAFSFVPEYVTSLVATTRMLNEKEISYHLLHKSGSFIPSTREQVATDSHGHNWKTNEIGGGKYTYKKIIWIDSDIEWTPEDFLRIYDSEMDVVSGVYQTHPNGTVAVNLSDPQGRPTLVNKSDFLLHWDPIEVGGVSEYVIRVANQGTKPASGVRVSATLLGDMEPVDARGPSPHRVDNLTISFEPLAKLAPSEEATYRIRVRGRREGDQRVQVQLTSDDQPAPITKEESTRVDADR